MNILVIGCDQVGASLIRDLERIGHDISLIERDPEQLKRLDAFDDYRIGGTALVGISKTVIKAHGSSNAYAFQNAIRQASQSVSSGLIENITANIDLMRLDAPEKE